MASQEPDNLLKDPRTNWNYILIVVILGILAAGGILGYYYLWIKDLEAKLAELEVRIPEKVTKKETSAWQIYQYEGWGFSIKIHPDYTKREEKEIERGEIRIKAIIFSADNEEIIINIDQSEDVKMLRPVLFDALKEVEISQEEGVQYLKYFWGIIDPGVEVISVEKVERGTCVGIQFIEKRGGRYERTVLLTSLHFEDMYLTASFKNYTKNTESKILRIIETIKCTK